MSFILEALRRSEQERRHHQDNSTSLLLPLESGRRRRGLPWLLAGLIGANLAALAWLLLREPSALPQESSTAGAESLLLAAGQEQAPTASLAELVGRPVPLAQPPVAADAPPQPAPAAPPPPEAAPPWLFELSESFRQSLPPIEVGMHVYASQPRARFVMLDGRQYREGQELAPGLRLLEITAQGLILSYQGQRFQMPLR